MSAVHEYVTHIYVHEVYRLSECIFLKEIVQVLLCLYAYVE